MASSSPKHRRLVVLASPFAGEVARNRDYARAAMVDSLNRGEAPLVPHLLYPEVLDDSVPDHRAAGLACSLAWIRSLRGQSPFNDKRAALVVYIDLGISEGMQTEINAALAVGACIEPRSLEAWSSTSTKASLAATRVPDDCDQQVYCPDGRPCEERCAGVCARTAPPASDLCGRCGQGHDYEGAGNCGECVGWTDVRAAVAKATA